MKRPLPFCILISVERPFRLIPFKSSRLLGVLSENDISFDISQIPLTVLKHFYSQKDCLENLTTLEAYTNDY